MRPPVASGTATRLLIAAAFCGLLIYADLPTRSPYPGHTRVELSIKTPAGRPTGLRLRVVDAEGNYHAPLGHLPRPDTSRRTSGDLILGDDETTPREVWALVYDGAKIDLPAGDYTFTARKGFEFHELRKRVSVGAGNPPSIALPLRQFQDFEAKGWYPGDTHMHFPDPTGVRYEMECEGLRVCSLLVLKSGYEDGRPGEGHFWNAEHFTGKLSPVSDSRHFVKVGEEFRHGLLAHLIFQNITSLVWPVSTGGRRENGAGGFDWPLMLHAADDVHQQGGLVTWAHWPYPTLEAPLDIALGRVDSVDLLTTGSPFEHHSILTGIYKMKGPKVYSLPPIDVYYHYLNCGFHIAASSGSDKMSLNPPMGSARTYVKTAGPLTYDSWIEGIRAGRTFATNYPLLEFTVNGHEAGKTITADPGDTLRVTASAASIEPFDVLEIIHNGRVVISRKATAGESWSASIAGEIKLETGGWIAARAWGKKMLPYGRTWWMQPVFAHTSPVYIDAPGNPPEARAAAALFLDQLGYLEDWARNRANFPTPANRGETLRLIAEAEAVYQKLAP